MQRLQQPVDLGRRVVVWGSTGAGKTTFSRLLGNTWGVRVVELDAIRHARGWDSTDWPDFRRQLTEMLDGQPEGWVTEGSYRPISDVYLSRADSLIWLRLPWRVSFWRLLKRTVARAWTNEPLYNENGPRESWRLSFLSPKSILWWSVSHHRLGVRNARERIAQLPETVRVYELRSSREVATFLRAVETHTAGLQSHRGVGTMESS